MAGWLDAKTARNANALTNFRSFLPYSERAASKTQLVSDLCDLTIPTAALGLVAVDDGFVGIAGTVSSLIGMYSQWKKTA